MPGTAPPTLMLHLNQVASSHLRIPAPRPLAFAGGKRRESGGPSPPWNDTLCLDSVPEEASF